MTYKELIRLFAHQLGIPDTEGRLALEVFAKHLLRNIELGDQIVIESLGYFALKKALLPSPETNEHQVVLLFSNKMIAKQDKDILLFFLPNENQKEVPIIDSFLNLSFGKQIITARKDDENGFTLPTSHNELIGLIESKVEKLIFEADLHKKSFEGEEEFIISPKQEEVLFDTADNYEKTYNFEQESFEEKTDIQIPNDEEKLGQTFDNYRFPEDDTEEITGAADPNVQPELTNPKSSLTKEIKTKRDFTVSKPKKSNFRKLVFSLIAILILASSVIGVYLNLDKLKNLIAKYSGSQSQIVEQKEKVIPMVISRTTEIQTAYPALIETDDSMIISQSAYGLKQDSIIAVKGVQGQIINQKDEGPDVLIEVGDNIYQKGSEYIVQISSWKSKTKAENEVKKFTSKGYAANFSVFTSVQLGKVYRVRIGGFKTLAEANNFLNTNK